MTATSIANLLLAGLAVALLVACYTDLRSRIISNRLNVLIALAAPVWWWANGLSPTAMGIQVGLAAVTFAIACLLFISGQMGGGDVKLLSALGLWFAPVDFLQVVMLMAVVGGGASVAMAAWAMQRRPHETLRDVIGWLAASLWVIGTGAVTYALAMDRPLIASETARHVIVALPHPAAGIALLVALLGLLMIGLRHVLRRQNTRIAVPYGLAISAGALWVMAKPFIVTV